jgi:hypothetical protein
VEITNKEKIVKSLLESPKSTGEIAKDLGFIDAKGYGRYNFVLSDLHTLEQYGFIHRIKNETKKPGKKPTTYELVYNIETIRKIALEYPFIVDDLQNSMRVCEKIRDSILGEKRIQDLDLPFDQSNMLFYNVDIPFWFTSSPHFFNFCLFNDSKTIESRWKEYFLLEYGVPLSKRKIMTGSDGKLTLRRDAGTDSKTFEDVFLDILPNIFEHSVKIDIVNGRSNPEAVKYIMKKRKGISEEKIKVNAEMDKNLIAMHDIQLTLLSDDERKVYFDTITKKYKNKVIFNMAYNGLQMGALERCLYE